MEENIKDIISDLDNLDVKVARGFAALHNKAEQMSGLLDATANAVSDYCAKLTQVDEKLDRILAYIDKVESPRYQQALDNKEILINLLANAVITKLFAMFNNGQNQ